ncbi:MAG: TIGR00268 family protein, partial [Candidatus Aminicenantes bacterium]|nr:TIGR00268 family protein [Candidatus Aminicenantes bacterium]
GSIAAEELGIRSPLKEARFIKSEIRKLSKQLGLPTWNKPSMACLASRFPYYMRIDMKSLKRVSQAEDFLRALGFSQIRVRHHGQIARIEIEPKEFPEIMEKGVREKIVKTLKKLGYTYITVDLAGYRTGSMNEPLSSAVNRKP